MCSRSPQNLEFGWSDLIGHFTLLFCRGRRRNVPKFLTHFILFFSLIPIVLYRCRCRRRSSFSNCLFIFVASWFHVHNRELPHFLDLIGQFLFRAWSGIIIDLECWFQILLGYISWTKYDAKHNCFLRNNFSCTLTIPEVTLVVLTR